MPAQYLTFGDILDARKAKLAADEVAKMQRQEQKKDRDRKRAENHAKTEQLKSELEARRAAKKTAKESRKKAKSIPNRKRKGSSLPSVPKCAREGTVQPDADAAKGLLDLASSAPECSK